RCLPWFDLQAPTDGSSNGSNSLLSSRYPAVQWVRGQVQYLCRGHREALLRYCDSCSDQLSYCSLLLSQTGQNHGIWHRRRHGKSNWFHAGHADCDLRPLCTSSFTRYLLGSTVHPHRICISLYQVIQEGG